MATAPFPPGLTDTDILIDALRNMSIAVNFLADQQAQGGIRLSIVSAMELVVGCRNNAELAQLQQFLATTITQPVTSTGSRQALQWLEQFRLSHGLLIPDALIAATTLEHGLPLTPRTFVISRC
jgi:predicted nucleic acid-binding protein